MKRVFYLPKAVADIDRVFTYSYEEWGYEQALAYLAGLEAICTQLARFPKLGREAFTYRRLRYERHVIFYRSERTKIVVVRILHERMIPKRHL